jgi:hypothetical protein
MQAILGPFFPPTRLPFTLRSAIPSYRYSEPGSLLFLNSFPRGLAPNWLNAAIILILQPFFLRSRLLCKNPIAVYCIFAR